MPLQIMQNLYTESWLYLTGHCLLNMFIKQCLNNKSMFVKHHFVAVVVCLFVVGVSSSYYYYHYYYYLLLLLLFIYFIILVIFNWYKLDYKFFAELCNFFFQFQINC